jgi:hypothetical protein
VSRYVITVTPDTGRDRDAQNAQTTVRVDTSTGQTRITELTVRAGSRGGLAPADMPALDLDLLVRALTGRGATPLAEQSASAPARKATRRRGGRAAAGTAKKTTARKARVATGRRAYRRMPEPEQVLAAYEKVGTITGLASHFDVPRHTATGWARRLRSMGYPIGRA